MVAVVVTVVTMDMALVVGTAPIVDMALVVDTAPTAVMAVPDMVQVAVTARNTVHKH